MVFVPDIPIYLQIATQIKERIVSGDLAPGDKLPSVREYSLIFEVSPLTIQRAIQHLDNENVIYSKKGVGSFVAAEGRNLCAACETAAFPPRRSSSW